MIHMPFRPFVAPCCKADVALKTFQAPAAQGGTDVAVPAGLEDDLTECTDPDRADGIFKNETVNSFIHNRS